MAKETMGQRSLRWYILKDGDELTLVDVGLPGSVCRWLESGQEPTGRIVRVVLTHCDADHIGDGHAIRQRYPEAQVLAHPLDRDWIENHQRLTRERYDHARDKYGHCYPPDVLAALGAASGPDFELTGTVQEGNRLHAGGRDWAVLHTPGHSPGHIVLWAEQAGILIGGDVILGNGPPDESTGKPSMPATHQFISEYLQTIDRLEQLGVRQAFTAHWPEMDAAEFARFAQTSREVVERDLRALREAQSRGVEDFEELLYLLNEEFAEWPESERAHYSYALAGYLEYLQQERAQQ